MQTISDLQTLLSNMQPKLDPGRYAFVSLPPGDAIDFTAVVASIREPEGLSVIMPECKAHELGLPIVHVAAWITLTVNSDLVAVGLTAAFSRALSENGISCNVVAGVHHDHLFVPVEQAEQAMEALRALQCCE